MTPALRARLFVAVTAEVVRGFRFSGYGVGTSVVSFSGGSGVNVARRRKGFMATEAKSSWVSWSVSSSESECSTVSFCLLERRLANPAVLLSAAASKELLRFSSSSLRLVSRNSLYLRTAISFSPGVKWLGERGKVLDENLKRPVERLGTLAPIE